LAGIEDKFSAFSSKIKTLLRNDHEDSKENLSFCTGSGGGGSGTGMLGLTRSALLKKAEQQVREAE
jgi:hypothetical protein